MHRREYDATREDGFRWRSKYGCLLFFFFRSKDLRISKFQDEMFLNCLFFYLQIRNLHLKMTLICFYPTFLKTTSTFLFIVHSHICPVSYIFYLQFHGFHQLTWLPHCNSSKVCAGLCLFVHCWFIQVDCCSLNSKSACKYHQKFNYIQMCKLKLGHRAQCALMPGSICLQTSKVVKSKFPVFILVSHL